MWVQITRVFKLFKKKKKQKNIKAKEDQKLSQPKFYIHN